ncbi:hypothetical protein HanHA300_Chr16g0589491 [Helianthus annuus]|nr:hypothetical protein HanHA300_Chr16g0589491 [Helianthus annuus]KAJ0458578.1 hypothetical protein HanHA89_Chr16g0639381 [Helianthus annuus]KAJ0639118.1 hypothetical protein HanLR1_Chr16g0600291 [Helianthus annuus]KAJ0643089.1 hypothetical protein HanOQP8_Chr16g0596731 [Helianthus annuus]
MGLGEAGLVEFPPLVTAGVQNKTVGSDKIKTGPSLMKDSPGYGPGMKDQILKHDGPILDAVMGQNVRSKGSGFFDVSKQDFGLGPSLSVNVKNSFGSLRDEEDCFDTDLGLWENEIEVVKKFVESNTRPKLEDYDSWSANMKKYYDSMTKMNEDDEVASETDEMARFMKSGVKA